MILLIDNYDSFSYNLFQLIGEVNPDIMVYRNDIDGAVAFEFDRGCIGKIMTVGNGNN